MFCNVHDFRVLHKSVTLFMFYKSPFYEFTIPFFVNRSLQHSTLYEPTFCTVHFRVTTFFVYTLRHNPCFGHKVHVLQRPRFLSSFFISLCYILVFVLQIHILRILCQSDSSTLNVLRVYVCTIHFLKTTFCDSTLQTCSYKSVLQLYSLNICFTKSIFCFTSATFLRVSVLRLLPRQCLSQSMFCRLPFTYPRLSRFAHAVQILHS